MESQEFQSKLKKASLHDNVNISTELVSQTLVAACKTPVKISTSVRGGIRFQSEFQSEFEHYETKPRNHERCPRANIGKGKHWQAHSSADIGKGKHRQTSASLSFYGGNLSLINYRLIPSFCSPLLH